MGPVSCIGTTDTRLDRYEREVTDEDRNFILSNINSRLDLPRRLSKKDIIAERCGVRTLIADGDEEDWIRLSRKHVIEHNKEKQLINIIGGKLTNCLNIGEEMIDLFELKGETDWFGEPGEAEKNKFNQACREVILNKHVQDGIDPPAERLWRRYGRDAFKLLEMITEDESMQDEILEGTGVLRAEVFYARENEMVHCLEDFLRRRSKVSLIKRKEDLQKDPGLKDVCNILFGSDSEQKWTEYFT